MKLRFGGNAQKVWQSLDEKFLQEDVASLAMLSYEVPIRDGSFFSDEHLLALYSKKHCKSSCNLPETFPYLVKLV